MSTDAMLFDGFPDPSEPDIEPDPAIAAPVPMSTERSMLDLLHYRYSAKSQADLQRFVCAEHVRAYCGFAGWSALNGPRVMRTADFLAQDLWENQGLNLHGHEVKVSRSDWLHELADPTKAEAIKRYCDRWWLVVPTKAIVRDDLPDDWGLLVIGKGGALRVAKSAPPLDPEPWPPTFRASLMRAVAKTSTKRAKGC